MKAWVLLFVSLPLNASDIPTRLKWLLQEPLLGLSKFETHTPPTVATAELGKLLFYDKRLSKDGTVSCATCHIAANAFSSQTAVSTGVGNQKGTRKANPIINRAFFSTQFWDGRALSLEDQVVGPIENPIEMATTREKVITTLEGIKGYSAFFVRAFGTPVVTLKNISTAIADFERTLLSGNSKWDKWQNNPSSVNFTAIEERGYEIFNDRECHICHVAPAFTDNLFHNSGVAFKNGKFVDEGRFIVTKSVVDTGAFKTPTLRGLLSHAPYMHDGSIATLDEVVEFYDVGGNQNSFLSEHILPLGLSKEDKGAMVAFLKTLEGEGADDTPPKPEDFPQ